MPSVRRTVSTNRVPRGPKCGRPKSRGGSRCRRVSSWLGCSRGNGRSGCPWTTWAPGAGSTGEIRQVMGQATLKKRAPRANHLAMNGCVLSGPWLCWILTPGLVLSCLALWTLTAGWESACSAGSRFSESGCARYRELGVAEAQAAAAELAGTSVRSEVPGEGSGVAKGGNQRRPQMAPKHLDPACLGKKNGAHRGGAEK